MKFIFKTTTGTEYTVELSGAQYSVFRSGKTTPRNVITGELRSIEGSIGHLIGEPGSYQRGDSLQVRCNDGAKLMSSRIDSIEMVLTDEEAKKCYGDKLLSASSVL